MILTLILLGRLLEARVTVGTGEAMPVTKRRGDSVIRAAVNGAGS